MCIENGLKEKYQNIASFILTFFEPLCIFQVFYESM